MCCTVGEAKLTDTKLYVGEANLNGKYVHVLAYQNSAINFSGAPNAMVIPFPADVKMTQDNIIDTSKFKGFLQNITDATKMEAKRLLGSDSLDAGLCFEGVVVADVFESGSYTVILAEKASQIPEALTRVAENKRPTISNQFLLKYNSLYPNQPIAVCCWDGNIEDVEPLLWWYEPKDQDTLFAPTMDAHDGNPPDLEAMVNTDHIISVGSAIDSFGYKVKYSDTLSEQAQSLLPKKVLGHKARKVLKNGDMFASLTQLKKKSDNPIIRRSNNVNHGEEYFMNGWMA